MTLQGLKQQSEGVDGLEDFVSRLDQDVEVAKRQIIESKAIDSQIWGCQNAITRARRRMLECDASIAEFQRQKREAIQFLERYNHTLQELQEKARSEKVGSWGPSFCKINVDAQGQDEWEDWRQEDDVEEHYVAGLVLGFFHVAEPAPQSDSPQVLGALAASVEALHSTVAAIIPKVQKLSRANPPQLQANTLVQVTPKSARVWQVASASSRPQRSA